MHGRASFIITTHRERKIIFAIDKTEENNAVCMKVMETKKITWFCNLYKCCEAANFISDESSFQGLPNYILFFSFYKVVEELLKKENRNLLVKVLKINKHTIIASWLVFQWEMYWISTSLLMIALSIVISKLIIINWCKMFCCSIKV